MPKLDEMKFMGIDLGVRKGDKTRICVITVSIEEVLEDCPDGAPHAVLHLKQRHNIAGICVDAGPFNEGFTCHLIEIAGGLEPILAMKQRTDIREIILKGNFSDTTAFTSACLAATATRHQLLPIDLLPPISEYRRQGFTL